MTASAFKIDGQSKSMTIFQINMPRRLSGKTIHFPNYQDYFCLLSPGINLNNKKHKHVENTSVPEKLCSVIYEKRILLCITIVKEKTLSTVHWCSGAFFLHGATGGMFHIINKLLHSAFTSYSVVVRLPVLSLRIQVSWNRSRNPSEEQASSQPRVHWFFQVIPSRLGPVDA